MENPGNYFPRIYFPFGLGAPAAEAMAWEDSRSLFLGFLICLWILVGPSESSSYGDHVYNVGDVVPLFVNKLGPLNNPSETYRYYDMPFCCPDNAMEKAESLGEILNGDRLMDSIYKLDFRIDKHLEPVCKKKFSKREVVTFRDAVKQDYYYQMYYDDLPLWGFIGKIDEFGMNINNTGPAYYLFKHIQFDIFYNQNQVIEVKSFSDPGYVLDVTENAEGEVEFTYTVLWHETSASFNRRTEKYLTDALAPRHSRIHWFSIINALVVTVLLIGFLAAVFMRTLKNDLTRYSHGDEEEDKEYGWKHIHGDMFRYPPYSSLLSAVLGSGTQLLTLTLLLFVLALGGVFYPYNCGTVCTFLIVLYALTSLIASYVSSKFQAQCGENNQARSMLLTVFLFPGPVFLTFLVLNMVAFSYNATAALPFGTIVSLLCIWIFVAIPLLIAGYLLRKVSRTEFLPPCATKRLPSEIPLLAWYRRTIPQMLLAGFLPFSIIFIELHYILLTLWGHKIYTVYGIWFVIFVILIIVTAFLSIGLTYFQLSVEDYRWWWRSILCGGSTAIFMYGYCCYFYAKSEMTSLIQLFFFFGYNACICYAAFLMLGTIAFQSSFLFICHIYGAIKSD